MKLFKNRTVLGIFCIAVSLLICFAIKASIFNRKEGVVDSVLLRFMDVCGKQKVGNPNFREGVEPHIWADGGKTDWYVFHPSKADYQKLAAGVERYLSVFQDMEMTQSPSYGSQQISP